MLHLKDPADSIIVNGEVVFMFQGISGFNPRPLQHQNVFIDGTEYHVLRVETYAIYDATGHNFGLMVRPVHRCSFHNSL